MVKLPEKGDTTRAIDVLNRRIEAAMEMAENSRPSVVDVGNYGQGEGDGADAYRRMFGDLIDVEELIEDFAASAATHAAGLIAQEELDPLSAIASGLIQAAALGALIERARWTA